MLHISETSHMHRLKDVPLVEHSSKVVIGCVVGNGFGVQGSVDSWLPSLHSQAIQLNCRSDAACKKEMKNIYHPSFDRPKQTVYQYPDKQNTPK